MKIKPTYIIIAILLGIIIISNLWNKPKDIDVQTIIERDTIILTKIDTIKQYYPKEVETIIRDTIVVYRQEKEPLKLYYQNKHYKDKYYDAWISGYNPQLDSIRVYKETEYKTITNTITNNIYKEKWHLYLDVGANKILDTYSPNIGLSLTMPNGFKLSGELGLYDKNIFYGLKIGYKLK